MEYKAGEFFRAQHGFNTLERSITDKEAAASTAAAAAKAADTAASQKEAASPNTPSYSLD
jgi:hypothetical protein